MLMEVYGLSVTEARVVRLTIAGESRSDIAKMLFVSANTVDRHAARIHQRIGRPLKSLRGREAEGLLEELDVKLKKAAARAG
jgi:transposase